MKRGNRATPYTFDSFLYRKNSNAAVDIVSRETKKTGENVSRETRLPGKGKVSRETISDLPEKGFT